MIDTSNLLYFLESQIGGLDFNPSGEYMATIDPRGVCLISDVNKNDYSSHLQFPADFIDSGNFKCVNIFSRLY